MSALDERLSVKMRDAVTITGISERTLRDAVRAGELEVRYPHKGTRNYVILTASLRRWLDSSPNEPPPKDDP